MATTVETSPYRPSGPSQHEVERPEIGDDRGIDVSRIESIAVLVLFTALYLAIGYRATIANHVIVFDALDRLARAYLVWHNDPPKLAAVGFLFPPLSTMVFLPLAAIKPIATSLVALPVTTAVFAGATMSVLNLIFARCALPIFMRIPVLLAFGLTPIWLFYAGNGMSEAVYLYLLAGGMYAFISWHTTRDARYLVISGGAFALALLTRYGFMIWALLMAVLIGVGLVAVRRTRNEVEGSMVAYLAPIVYALALWTLFNLLIVGRPFEWLTDSPSGLAVNAATPTRGRDSDLGDVAAQLLELIVAVSPLTLVALPALIVMFVLQRNDMALWLGGFLTLSIVLIGAGALMAEDVGVLTIRGAMPVMLTTVIGAAWLYRSLESGGVIVAGAAALLLVVGWFTNWHGMGDYPFQNGEQAFQRQLLSGQDQVGQPSRGGFQIGIEPERQMAAYIKDRLRLPPDPRGDDRPILTDNAQTFGVILLTGRPDIFLDRIDVGDRRWRAIVRNPVGRLARREGVRYMLVASKTSADQIRQLYQREFDGEGARFSRVFETERYLLVEVNPEAREAPAFGQSGQSGQRGQTPVSPSPPLLPPPPTTQPGAAGNAPATPGSPSQQGAPLGTP